MVQIELKDKFLATSNAQKNGYRTRTGPTCCTRNCAKRRKGLSSIPGAKRPGWRGPTIFLDAMTGKLRKNG